MILKGVSRADGGQLAAYLLSSKNEQVRIVDVRGTVIATCDAAGLKSALRDMDEYGKMTRAQKPIFHLAMNPAQSDRLSKGDWLRAAERAEEALGLLGHARAIVSHTYQGKEHYHVVWSRVDVEERKCVPLSHSNLKLCRLARELEIELGLQQIPSRARGEHQLRRELKARDVAVERFKQERAAQSPDQIKTAMTSAWDRSQNGREFALHLEAAGLRLRMGDRGPVAVDRHNVAYSPARLIVGVRAKDVKTKCADIANALPALERDRGARSVVMVPSRAHIMVRDELALQIANDVSQARERGLEMGL